MRIFGYEIKKVCNWPERGQIVNFQNVGECIVTHTGCPHKRIVELGHHDKKNAGRAWWVTPSQITFVRPSTELERFEFLDDKHFIGIEDR